MPRQVPLLRPGADPKPRCPGVDASLRRDSAGVRRAVQSKMPSLSPQRKTTFYREELKDDIPQPHDYLISHTSLSISHQPSLYGTSQKSAGQQEDDSVPYSPARSP